MELGKVIFFSEAAKTNVSVRNKKMFLDAFVNEVLENYTFSLDAQRPRFTLAKLRHIVDNDLHPSARMALPYLAKLLRPYLGPDGW